MSKKPKKKHVKPAQQSPLNMVYNLCLTFAGPLLSQQVGALKLGVDTAMQRYRNKPVINGSLIRGNLRDYLQQLFEVMPENKAERLQRYCGRWFGEPSAEGGMEPERGKVAFDMFWQLDGEYHTDAHRTRIQINEYGSVAHGALQTIEDCFPAGTEASFSGKLHAQFPNQDEKERFEKWLYKALELIPAMGSLKGIGYGKLIKAKLMPVHGEKKQPLTLPDGATRFGISLHLDRPICIGKPRTPGSNRIVSDDFISGNVIKAVIANLYDNDSKRLEETLCFDQLLFSHAYPSSGSQRPLPALPLSLAWYQKELFDMSDLQDFAHFPWQDIPRFQPDWKEKDWQEIGEKYNLQPDKPERLLMVRTGINSTAGVAAEGELFSVECVDTPDFVWLGNVDLRSIPENQRQTVLQNLLAVLEQGLNGIGKTKANARVEVHGQAFTPPHGALPAIGETAIVTLVSAARLLPLNLEKTWAEQHQVGDTPDDALAGLYQNYWQTVSNEGLSLQRYFAQQRRHGGVYLYEHFQGKASPYCPEWLTQAGSVFVVKIESEAGLQCLQKWMEVGLPAHPDADGKTATWRNTPYLPEHGFGEICVNWPAQTSRQLSNREGN